MMKPGKPVECIKDATGKIIEFTIERSRWARVHPEPTKIGNNQVYTRPCGSSLLLNDVGGMCCLGFYARACGIDPADIFYHPGPRSLNSRLRPSQMNWLLESNDGDRLMSTNDLSSPGVGLLVSPEDQEKEIKKSFAKHGVKVSFVS